MKTILSLVALTLITLTLAAQEDLPRTEAVKFAAVLNFDLEKIADTPIPTDADIKRPFGLKAGNLGGLLLELLVFGKGKEPLLALPLNLVTREQKWPLEFTAEGEGDGSARLTLSLVGKYEASFLVTKASD